MIRETKIEIGRERQRRTEQLLTLNKRLNKKTFHDVEVNAYALELKKKLNFLTNKY